MIFKYGELKECVKEDFERFYKMGFQEDQIFPAVLNEYEHGEDFDFVENVCIHVFLTLLYGKVCWDCSPILNALDQLMNEEVESEIMAELGNEYSKFITDLGMAKIERPVYESN